MMRLLYKDTGPDFRVMRMTPDAVETIGHYPTEAAALAALDAAHADPANRWAFFWVRDPDGRDLHSRRPAGLDQ